MNRDILVGNWKQLRGEIKRMWGEITDDDLDRIEGHFDKFVGALQERYGYAREEAEAEIDEFLADYEERIQA